MHPKQSLNILFMGSAGFAVPCLQQLVDSPHTVLEVVTQPDKPAGRGQKMHACPVAAFARDAGLPLFQPNSVKKAETLAHFQELKPDLIVIVAYGKILPKKLIEIPPLGAINVHASLLPKYRGAAPITWAIANGEGKTGVTTMFINEELDAGDILLSATTPIDEAETAASLHDRLASMGAELLLTTITRLQEGILIPQPQEHANASYAPLLNKEDGHIDWSSSSQEIFNRIRAFTPWPGCFTLLDGKKLRIHEAATIDTPCNELPGTVLECEEGLAVACGHGILYLLEIQLEGKRRMSTQDFLRGNAIEAGKVLQ